MVGRVLLMHLLVFKLLRNYSVINLPKLCVMTLKPFEYIFKYQILGIYGVVADYHLIHISASVVTV